MKKAIIYGRVSTNKQSFESIETQIEECEKWAKENNCIIIDIYDDSGQSGRSYNVGNRKGFQQIREDARLGRMDYALVHKVDRFARDAADYFIQERELEQYGVELIIVGMPFIQEADIMVKSMYISMAEHFSKNLSSEVYVKMRTFAKKGAFLGGKPPYGFSVVGSGDEKKLEINPEEALGVRLIYDLYMQSFGYIQISKILYEKGFRNSLGNPFTANHIRKILTSKKYNGYYVYGTREKVKGKDKRTTDKSKIIEVPNILPKIIEDDLFSAVQMKMSKNGARNKRRIRYYPFTGVATCGVCGRAITGYCTVKKDRGTVYTYYRCTGRKLNGCTLPSIKAEYIENYVLEKIQENVFDNEFTDRLIAEIELHLSGDVSTFLKIKNDCEKELEIVNAKIKEGIKDRHSLKYDERMYNEVMEEYQEEKMLLEVRLEQVTSQLNVSSKTESIKKYIKRLKADLVNASDEVKFAILKQGVQSVVVTPEKAEVFVFMSPIEQNKRLYKDRLSITPRGVPLFVLDEQENEFLSNINRGDRRATINGQKKVFTDNGMNVISFEMPI